MAAISRWKTIKAEDFNKLRLQCLSNSFTSAEMLDLLVEHCHFLKTSRLVPTLVEFGIIRKRNGRYYFKDTPEMLPMLQRALQTVTNKITVSTHRDMDIRNYSDDDLILELKRRQYIILKQF